jgi:hypothetical protein
VGVDVQSEIVIARPRAEVAAFACDPDNATAWYENITSVEWDTPPPPRVGSRIVFVAEFLGRPLTYTYEIRELDDGQRFVMSTDDGPYAMQTTYAFQDADGGGTRMTLRNVGEPVGLSKLSGPVVAAAMRRANRKDLKRLKKILEAA